MMRSPALLSATLLAAAGCSSSTSSGLDGECTANNDCPAGQVCTGGACIPLCSADAQCPAGQVCQASTCTAGTRDTPEILSINGDDPTLICPDGTGTHCILSGLVVGGNNLEGSLWMLRPSPAGTDVELMVRAGSDDTTATLDLPDTVADGDYVLSATNGAGSADQPFTIIQGPPGPDKTPNELVDDINLATNQIAVQRLPVGMSSGMVSPGDHGHDAASITSGVLDTARIPGHAHDFMDINGGVGFGQLPTGTGAMEVAVGNHGHASSGCYTHWGGTGCMAGYTAVLNGFAGGQESYTGAGGTPHSNIECLDGGAASMQNWTGGFANRMMRSDIDSDGMSKITSACSICCRGGCYTAMGTNQCAAGYQRAYEGRTGGIELYTGGQVRAKTLCLDLAAPALNTWAAGYSTRLMRHKDTTGSGDNGMQHISSSCAVCCQ